MSFMKAMLQKMGFLRGPSKRDRYFFRIASLRRRNEHNNVIVAATRAIEEYPNDEEFHALRGLSYQECREYDKAIVDFTFVYESDPENDVIYRYLLDAFNGAGRYKEAIDLATKAIEKYRSAIRRDPEYTDKSFYPKNFYRSRAFSHYMLGNYENALEDFQRALDLEPSDYMLYLELLQPVAAVSNKSPMLAQKAAHIIIDYTDRMIQSYAARAGLLDLKKGAEQILKEVQGHLKG